MPDAWLQIKLFSAGTLKVPLSDTDKLNGGYKLPVLEWGAVLIGWDGSD